MYVFMTRWLMFLMFSRVLVIVTKRVCFSRKISLLLRLPNKFELRYYGSTTKTNKETKAGLNVTSFGSQ